MAAARSIEGASDPMTSEMEAGRRASLQAAMRRFPSCSRIIERLAADDEGFRELCEELAEAEQACVRLQGSPSAQQSAWEAEWLELIERLTTQVAAALEAKVVSIDRVPPSRSR